MTDKATKANQANAGHSSGPRTLAGKAKSSRNATRTGVWADVLRPILTGEFAENEAAFEEYVAQLREDLAPRGPLEEEIVTNIIMILVRLRRAFKAQASQFEALTTSADRSDPALPPEPGRHDEFWRIGAFQLLHYLTEGAANLRLYSAMALFLREERLKNRVPTGLTYWTPERPPASDDEWHQTVDELIGRCFKRREDAEPWVGAQLDLDAAHEANLHRRETINQTAQVTDTTALWTATTSHLYRQLNLQLDLLFEVLQSRLLPERLEERFNS